jgi:hypothetical protein
MRKKMFIAMSNAYLSEGWVGPAADAFVAEEIQKAQVKFNTGKDFSQEAMRKNNMTDQQIRQSLFLFRPVEKPEDVRAGAQELVESLGGKDKAQPYLREFRKATEAGGLGKLRKSTAGFSTAEEKDGAVVYGIFDNPDRKVQEAESSKEFLDWGEKIDVGAAARTPISIRGRDAKGNIVQDADQSNLVEYQYMIRSMSVITGAQFNKLKLWVADLKKADPSFNRKLLADLRSAKANNQFVEKLEASLFPPAKTGGPGSPPTPGSTPPNPSTPPAGGPGGSGGTPPSTGSPSTPPGTAPSPAPSNSGNRGPAKSGGQSAAKQSSRDLEWVKISKNAEMLRF